MAYTAQRLLRLIGLLQSRRHWSGAELAERMQVDRRSIRRDIERLRELGYPISASSGVGGGYRLGGGASVLPLLLDEEEATAIALALRVVTASVSGLDDTAQSVLTKLDPLVPLRRRQQAGEIHAATATMSGMPSVDGRLLGQLAMACREHAVLSFLYCTHDGVIGPREAEAQHLVNYGQRWYLLGWDRNRDDWRTLRVDRISEVRCLPLRGTRRALPAPPEVVVRQAVSHSPFTLRAEVTLCGRIEALALQVPPWFGVLRADGPDHCRLLMGADSAAMLAGQILSLGLPPVAIRTTPPSLHAELQAQVAGLASVLAGGAAPCRDADGGRAMGSDPARAGNGA